MGLKPEYFLIWLEGQGDTHVCVVDRDSWDWIHNPDLAAPVPASAMERATKRFLERKAKKPIFYSHLEAPSPCNVTSGSWDNDRAIWLEGLVVDGVEMKSYTDRCEAREDLKSWRKILGIKAFDGTFQGCIY